MNGLNDGAVRRDVPGRTSVRRVLLRFLCWSKVLLRMQTWDQIIKAILVFLPAGLRREQLPRGLQLVRAAFLRALRKRFVPRFRAVRLSRDQVLRLRLLRLRLSSVRG